MSVPCFDGVAFKPRGVRRSLRQSLSALLLLGLMPWLALTTNVAAAPADEEPGVALSVTGAWVRAVPPNARTTAAYFVVHNGGQEPLSIASVSADVAGAAELHKWVEREGVKSMQRQDHPTLAANGKLVLKPAGLHMMLFRLDPVPSPGQQVQICLQLALLTEQGKADDRPGRQSEYCFAAEVRRP